MAEFIGAVPGELRALGTAFTNAGTGLEASAAELRGALARTTWQGFDAQRFQDDWATRHGPLLRQAAERLVQQGALLQGEADEQEAASDGSGGAPGPGGTAPGVGTIDAPVDQDANDEALAEHADAADPGQTAVWWQSLPQGEQQRLAEEFPDLVGNLEGADYDDRHTANVIRLDRDIAAAEEADRPFLVEDLEAVREQLEAGTDAVPFQLISYEPAVYETRYTQSLFPYEYEIMTERPLAAISLGDLDAASYATYVVPGMFSEVGEIGSVVTGAENLRAEQYQLMRENGLSGSNAVVAWVGYDSPDFITVLQTTKAEAGGERLEAALQGYDARLQASGGESILSISAHSYGSTTAAEALHGMPDGIVDNLVTVGSAGLAGDIDGAGDLAAGQVYSIMGDENVAGTGRNLSFRQDPRAADFGGVNISSLAEGSGASGYHPTTEHDMTTGGGDEWYGYYDPRTTSLHNQALITIGLGDEASRG